MLLSRRKLLADKKSLGRWGEKRSEKFLKAKGLKTLTRNFSCRTGEIDLIMVDHDSTIVFIEVRTRANKYLAPPEQTITSSKKAKLIKTARYFLATHDIENRPLRFDVVAVVLAEKGAPAMTHFENAFGP